MKLIPDDPIVACIERSGYPPWIDADFEEIHDDDAEDDPGRKESE